MRTQRTVTIMLEALTPCARRPSRTFRPLTPSPFASTSSPLHRGYATHRDRAHPSSAPSSSSSRASASPSHGSTARSAFEGAETVGPFPLGVGSSGRGGVWRPWKELGVGGKLGRTVKQSANLGIILLGGGLFVVLTLSLTTELFASNSPGVLYSAAVDKIRASDALNPYLLPPLSFTHTPHAAAPVRGTTPISHRLVRHPSSGRDHLILTFYVHGRGRDEPEPMSWAKDAWGYVLMYGREAGKWAGLIEESEGTEAAAQVVPANTVQKADAASSGPSWFGRTFGGLTTGRRGGSEASPRGLPPPGTYKVGEVHGDYVKNAGGTYQLLSLVVDVPASSASYPGRAVVFWSPEADKEGLIGKIGGRGR